MTKLAEAYFHLRPFHISDDELHELGRLTTGISLEVAARLFPPSAEVEVELVAGSAIGRALIIGQLVVGGLVVVSHYKDLRESVPLIVSDARVFAGSVINRVLTEASVPPKSVYRTERRTKTPGKLLRVLERREWLERNKGSLSKQDILRERAHIARLLRQIEKDLSADEQQTLRKLIGDTPTKPTPTPDRVAVTAGDRPQYPLFPLYDEHAAPPTSDFYARVRVGDYSRYGLDVLTTPSIRTKSNAIPLQLERGDE